ncbi:hypothetical protein [Neokomagataea thailandica]|uniref:hypothetical protein n=1 Tax=Neokomagataea TaxID=1223423 RepID=UPI000832A81F|nr:MULTISPECIES: hypothetical protein [Neokomagataea]
MIEILSDIITSFLFSSASYRGEKILRLHKKQCLLLRYAAWPALFTSLALHIEHEKNIGFALVCWCLGTSLALAMSGALLACWEAFKKPTKTKY